MYLIDINTISEARKGKRANPGVQRFFETVERDEQDVFLSVITIGELRRGIDLMQRRGDADQAAVLEAWLTDILNEYSDHILPIDADTAQLWAGFGYRTRRMRWIGSLQPRP